MPGADASVADWLAYQEQLHARPIDMGLERVAEVARRLGLLPNRTFTLTFAGTNGKGSSATLASLICREAGLRTGLYTSPHLYRYQERIRIDGEPVADAMLCQAFRAIEQARREISLTYFEFGTLAALWCFAQAQVQVQVLEVGLGGRLDAVNIVDADAAVVVSIGLDHQDLLGPDRESIGFEKAGVFRAERPAVCADPDPPRSVVQTAERLGARLWLKGRDFEYSGGADRWTWSGPGQRWVDLPLPGLPGDAQLRNASGVLAALLAVRDRLPVSEAAIRAALPRLQLPGRCEHRGQRILDVGHNAESAVVLAEHLRQLPDRGKIRLVLGMLSDKPVEAFAAALAPCVAESFFASLPPPRGLPAMELRQRASLGGLRGEAYSSVADALQAAEAASASEDWTVICGSFLTVAAVGNG